eukprot:12313138-Alexandrium_andersonii.AAC.1
MSALVGRPWPAIAAGAAPAELPPREASAAARALSRKCSSTRVSARATLASPVAQKSPSKRNRQVSERQVPAAGRCART